MKQLKKFFYTLLLILVFICGSAFVLSAVSAPITAEAATKVKINKKKLTLYKGKTYRLKITGTKKTVTWKSSKPSVAKVNSKGLVTAKKKGTAKITAKVGQKRYTCSVTVKAKLAKFSVSPTSVKLNYGKKKKVTVTYGGNGSIYYNIKDPKICSCKWEDGWDGDDAILTITGTSVGKTTVTITNSKDNRKLNITVNVTLKVTQYGSVSGNISYYYNQYFGNRADTGAYVILIPKNGAASKLSRISKFVPSDEQKNSLVYIAKADGVGNYKINHVAAGDYRVLLISYKTTTGAWFAAYDESISDAPDSYYDKIAEYFAPRYLKTSTAKNLVREIGSNKYYITDITIYNGEDTQLSHDFGMTYI